MAEKTTNLNLTKPSAEDFYDIDVQNENMDIIDVEMKRMDDESKRIDNDAKTSLDTHKKASNPHNITATTVGLGNVPNVATNDQTPTYTEASTLTNLISGEKFSVLLGKVKKAITSLISHLTDSTQHITSTERTKWNEATTAANSASTLLSDGAFRHLQEVELNVPSEAEHFRNWIIPMPVEQIKKATAIKIVIKGKVFGEVTSTTTGSNAEISLGVIEGEGCFYQTRISLKQLGSFSTKEFETSQEFIISKQLYDITTPQPISMNIENPPLRASYAFPNGFGSAHNIRTGNSTDYNVTDFRMKLVLSNSTSGYCKVGLSGTINVYIR